MQTRCRAFRWEHTPIGAAGAWPQSLRTVVQIALASSSPAIVLWGPELIQVYNDAYSTLMGVKHPAGLGQPTRECWPEVWHINEPIFNRVKLGESVAVADALYPITRSGELEDAWFTIDYIPVRHEAGTVDGVLVTVQETTARVLAIRAREEMIALLAAERSRFKEAFRRAPSVMAMLDGADLRFEFVNEAYSRLVGNRDVLGKTLIEALPELRGQPFPELLGAVAATGEPWIGLETALALAADSGANPETRYVDLIIHPLATTDGTSAGVVALGSDVTEQVRARQAIEALLLESEAARAEAVAARAEAEAASRAKGEFLAIMSHELRTPLNAIGGYTELMEMGIRGPITAEQRSDLARIQSSQRHLLGLINEVLNYSKLGTGTVHYALGPVVAREALAAAQSLVTPQARAQGLTLVVTECLGAPTVCADEDKLRQILVNLLSNAVKFTGRGGLVELGCHVAASDAYFVVKDNGIGIAPDQMERIFEPFVQVRSDFTRTQEGTGLGLAISRELAHGMGGELTVASTIGEGAVFTLRLPLA